MIRSLAVLAAVSGLLTASLMGRSTPARADAPAFHSADGLTLVSAAQTDARTWRLVVSTTALSQPVRVNVLLPDGYDASTGSYPVLYLLHGTSGTANDWLNAGNVAAATAGQPLIVVMPDGGFNGNGGSWYTNWVDQQTKLGASNWETFHVSQLVPWVDHNLRTVTSRSGRAIAGLSMGGFGAYSYAARHPDMFVAAASFSGAPDIASNPVTLSGAAGIISATAVGLDGVQPNAMFGDPVSNNINWQGHNPASLITNLGYTGLGLWCGNGVPGPLDTPTTTIVQDALIEGAAHQSTQSFTQVARKAHVAYTFNNYGNGTHSWVYWQRDLTQLLPGLMATFANPQPAPTTISYRSVDKTWTQWGWTVTNLRTKAQAFSGLVNASATRFTINSSSRTTITTPAVYVPGDHYHLSATGGSTATTATVSAGGRLTMTVTPALLQSNVTVSLTKI